MGGLSDIFGGSKKNIDGGGLGSGSPSIDGSVFDFEIPLDFGSSATSSASGWQGPLNFGSYSSSPITGSGNDQLAGGSIDNGLPVWVWLVVLIGTYRLAKKGAK